jgi:hypothetical protein
MEVLPSDTHIYCFATLSTDGHHYLISEEYKALYYKPEGLMFEAQ